MEPLSVKSICALYYVDEKGGIKDLDNDGTITTFGDTFLSGETCEFSKYPCSVLCNESLFPKAKVQAPFIYVAEEKLEPKKKSLNTTVSVHPNPFNHVLYLSIYSSENTHAKLRLYDMLGNLVMEQSDVIGSGFNHLKLNTDVASLHNQMYVLSVVTDEGEVFQYKLQHFTE